MAKSSGTKAKWTTVKFIEPSINSFNYREDIKTLYAEVSNGGVDYGPYTLTFTWYGIDSSNKSKKLGSGSASYITVPDDIISVTLYLKGYTSHQYYCTTSGTGKFAQSVMNGIKKITKGNGYGLVGDYVKGKKGKTYSKEVNSTWYNTVTPEAPSLSYYINNTKTAIIATADKLQEAMDSVQFYLEGRNIVTNGETANWATIGSPIKSDKVNNTAIASFTSLSNNMQYRIRARGSIIDNRTKAQTYGPYSDYGDIIFTRPDIPSILSVERVSSSSIKVSWNNAASLGAKYKIGLAADKNIEDYYSYTEVDDNVSSKILDASTGHSYFIKMAVCYTIGSVTSDYSDYSEVKTIIQGKKPEAPTTWSSSTIVSPTDILMLYWTHNSSDESAQNAVQLGITVDGGTENIITIDTSQQEEAEDKTTSYKLDISSYTSGATISWRARTKGVVSDYGEWSIVRTINVYVKSTLSLSILDYNKEGLIESDGIINIKSYPFYVQCTAGPSTQNAIGYSLSIIANEDYESVDSYGNTIMVYTGTELYSKYQNAGDTKNIQIFEITPTDTDLITGIKYKVSVTVAMNSGLTTDSDILFELNSSVENYDTPTLTINLNDDELTAYLTPFIYNTKMKAIKNGSSYTLTTTSVTGNGERLDDEVSFTRTLNDGENTSTMNFKSFIYKLSDVTYYYNDPVSTVPLDNVLLSVYRVTIDYEFIEIAKDITSGTTVLDPHPSLNNPSYRVVARFVGSGKKSYYDADADWEDEVPGMVIQWNENWAADSGSNEYSYNMVRLPYNVDVSLSNSMDVSFIEYIGRAHPVSYYGTQLGMTSTWSTDIPADEEPEYDSDNNELPTKIDMVNRLQYYLGDVYIRHTSGVGYWANVKPSITRNHNTLLIPVSFNVTRVEGGI